MKVKVKKDELSYLLMLYGIQIPLPDEVIIEATPIEEKCEPLCLCKTAADHYYNEAAGISCDCVIKPQPHRLNDWERILWTPHGTLVGNFLNQELKNLHARITELERRVRG